MVDYSKWDKLDISDDEDEKMKPRVQHFDAPQSVTIGGDDGRVSISPQASSGGGRADEINADEEDDDEPMEPDDEDLEGRSGEDCREDVLQCRALAERALRRGDAAEGVRLLEKAMRVGGEHCPGLDDVLQSARRQAAAAVGATQVARAEAPRPSPGAPAGVNGGTVEDRYHWSQTQESIEVNVFVPAETKAKDVRLEVSETCVRITVGGASVFDGEWEFKVDPEEDPDWEMRTCDGRRSIRLLVKKAKMPGGLGVVVWWKRVLKGDPGIDVGGIQERAGKQVANASFAKAWQEAHVQFREQVKSRQPTVVDA